MMRLTRLTVSLLALLALLLLVFGIPIALMLLVGWPVPDPIPGLDELGDMLAGRMPVPADLIISILASVMWLLWIQVAWAASVEAMAAFRGRLAQPAPIVPGVQLTIAKLVTAATLLTTTFSARPVAAGPLPPVAAVTQVDDASAPSDAAGATEAPAPAEASGPDLRPYLTEPGDTWWGIAEDTFGSGTRWKEIRNLNLGRTMDDGSVISVGTDLLRPDWQLLLPAGAAVPVGAGVGTVADAGGAIPPAPVTATTSAPTSTSEGSDREVVVEPGDTLWALAEEDLAGEIETGGADPSVIDVADRVDEIAEINRGQLNGNPDLIFPGQRLGLPERPVLAERAPGASTGVSVDVEIDAADAPIDAADAPIEVEDDAAGAPGDVQDEVVADTEDAPDEADDDAGDASADAPDEADDDAGGAPADAPVSPLSPIAPPELAQTPPTEAPPVEDEVTISPGPDADTATPEMTEPAPEIGDDLREAEEEAAVADGEVRTAATARFLPDSAPAAAQPPAMVVSTVDLPTAGSVTPIEDVAAGEAPGEDSALDTSSSRAPIFAGLAAITLLGGYLHRAKGRRRKTAMQSRHAGRMPKQHKRRTRTLARRLASAAEPEHPEFLNLGLRALGRLLEDLPSDELPKISGVWVSHNRLVLALSDESPRRPPPAPFTTFADGSGWSLQRSHLDEIRAIARGANGPLPLLTTVGMTTALDLALTTNSRAPADAYGLESSLLFAVDLEAGRVISVQAPRVTDVIETLSMMALELATSETADQAEIVCVGFGDRLASFDRVVVVDELDDIMEDLEAITGRAVQAAGDASPFATRVGNGAVDTWNPVIVFHADPGDPHARRLTELAELTEGGVTAVCGYPTETGWCFLVDGDSIRCPDLPGSLGDHRFSRPRPDEVDTIVDLFDESFDDVELGEEFWQPLDGVDAGQGRDWPAIETQPEPVISRAPADTTADTVAGTAVATMDPVEDPTPPPPQVEWIEEELPALRHSTEHRRDDDHHPYPTSATGGRHLYVVTPDVSGRTPREATSAEPEDAPATETLRINVLGNFTIGGFHVGDRNKPWKYTKTAELILYLLLHPAGASQDLLMEQLFPEQPPNRPRLNQLVSDARTKALGVDPSGEYHLPHASPTEPFYRLSPSIEFDLRDFAGHCANARRAESPEDKAREWTAALELVEGRPFTLPHDGYGWALPEIEATIVKVEEAAVALADVATELGDHNLAVWATRKGLLTGTGYYELLVKRGRAALLAEDPEEIVRAFADLQMSLDHGGVPEEGMPDLDHHPDLADVYNELSDGGRGRDRTP